MFDDILNGGVIWFLVAGSITLALVLGILGLTMFRRGDGSTQKMFAGALGLSVLSFVLLVGWTVFMTGPKGAEAADGSPATDNPDGEPMPAAKDEAVDEQAAGDVVETGQEADGKTSDGDAEVESDDTDREPGSEPGVDNPRDRDAQREDVEGASADE